MGSHTQASATVCGPDCRDAPTTADIGEGTRDLGTAASLDGSESTTVFRAVAPLFLRPSQSGIQQPRERPRPRKLPRRQGQARLQPRRERRAAVWTTQKPTAGTGTARRIGTPKPISRADPLLPVPTNRPLRPRLPIATRAAADAELLDHPPADPSAAAPAPKRGGGRAVRAGCPAPTPRPRHRHPTHRHPR